MAQSTINGTPTFSTSWTENGVSFTATRNGKIVVLQATTGMTTNALAANETLTTIPQGYKPTATAFVWNGSHSTQCAFTFRTNGKILVAGSQTLDASEYPRFIVTYFTNDDVPD